jgi:hypothetical protein
MCRRRCSPPTRRSISRAFATVHESAVGTFRTCLISELSLHSGVKRKLDLETPKGGLWREAAVGLCALDVLGSRCLDLAQSCSCGTGTRFSGRSSPCFLSATDKLGGWPPNWVKDFSAFRGLLLPPAYADRNIPIPSHDKLSRSCFVDQIERQDKERHENI